MEIRQELTSGDKLQNGEYTIEKKLGQGGFGITYLAFSKGLQCRLAIKEFFLASNCMRQPGDTSVHIHSLTLESFTEFKDRFISEARTLVQFDRHPNIVHVKNVFEENNTAYYVMDYMQGETLSGRIKRLGKLSFEDAINIIGQLCDATETIHAKGIIHRDINPSNIMITPDNKVILIDFGTAKEFIQGSTRSTQAVLTPGYAPEEQYSTVREKGKYSDVYSIGATFYYCLTGKTPTESIDRRSIMLPEPISINSDIPIEVNNAILKAMAIETIDRYQTIEMFLNDLLANEIAIIEDIQTEKKEVISEDVEAENVPVVVPEIMQGHNELNHKKKQEIKLSWFFVIFGNILFVLYILFVIYIDSDKNNWQAPSQYTNSMTNEKSKENTKQDSIQVIPIKGNNEHKNKSNMEIKKPENNYLNSPFSIGQNYEGGIICFIDNTGQHGLIAAKKNHGYTTWSIANTWCVSCNDGGNYDWHLPSKEELNLMYKNLHKKGLGFFSASVYWSSTVGGSGKAWEQSFNDGDQNYGSTNNEDYVRCVRSF